MVRECVMLYAVGSLRDLLMEEGECLRALSGPVEELKQKLMLMEDMFDDIAVRQDERTSDIVEHCNQMMDDIDDYVLRESTKIFGIRERMLRPKVLLKIQQLIVKITVLLSSHSGETIKVGQGCSSSLANDVPPLDEEDFVGREGDINSLVSLLVNDKEDKHHRVISICGMGGLGKTTLSKKVYKHKDVKSHFECFAFVCLGQDCVVKTILQKFLLELVPVMKEDIRFTSEADVMNQLQKVLSEKKCLVVVDDIWSLDAWTILCRALLTNDSVDSKILLTTRSRDVAEVGDIVYDLKCLSEEESWELLQRKALAGIRGRDFNVDTRMEKLGKEMVGWCRGNPLAVRVLRGVLVTKPSPVQWEMVYHRSKGNKHQQLVDGDVAEVLSLSYNELPYQLKPCYLYLCKYPHGERIKAHQLYLLWNAEGMIVSRDQKEGETMFDVAERYLGELVQRNMVEIDVDNMKLPKEGRKLKYCLVHDLMRELCLSTAKKENFLKITFLDVTPDDNDYLALLKKLVENSETLNLFSVMGCDSSKTPRHAIYFNPASKWHVNATVETTASIRSIRIFQGSTKKLSNLKKLKLLRVLELWSIGIGAGGRNLSKGIGDLIHMRLLSLKYLCLAKLPSSLGDLRHLQTLDLRVLAGGPPFAVTLPNVLRKLQKLRHLFLPLSYTTLPESSLLRLDGLHELETLVNFYAYCCFVKDLTDLTNLKKFKVRAAVSEGPSGVEDLEIIIKHIKLNLNRLRHTSLEVIFLGSVSENDKMQGYDWKEQITGSQQTLGDGWKQLLSGCHWMLHSLHIVNLRGELPELWRDDVNHQNTASCLTPLLTKLKLTGCVLEHDPMPTLEKFSNLQQLIVSYFMVKGGGINNEITCSASGFPQLKLLRLENTNLEKWRIEQGAMPNLSSLEILQCTMEMLPEGLKFITTLQTLSLMGMPDAMRKRIEPPDGEDFHKVQHVPYVSFTNHDYFEKAGMAYSHTTEVDMLYRPGTEVDNLWDFPDDLEV